MCDLPVGGGVMGSPGRLAAQTVIEDVKRKVISV